MNKLGLDRNDFESYEAYRKEYKRLYAKTDAGKESLKKAQAKYNKSDKAKLVDKKANQKYRQKNRGLCNARVNKIRAGKACPPWADLKAIEEIYKNCPLGKQVDHDYALNGENFSGLHIPENLQYLTPSENKSKGNKHV